MKFEELIDSPFKLFGCWMAFMIAFPISVLITVAYLLNKLIEKL